MITIISCTNRPNSRSISISHYYKLILEKKGAHCQIINLEDLPHDFIFSSLYRKKGKDEKFTKLVDLMRESEKFVFIVPEYNGSFPGVLKSFIDGLEYPSSFQNKKGALVGISSGAMAGALALSHLTDILNYLGMHILAIKPRLPRIEAIFTEGVIADKFLSDLIDTQAQALIDF